MTVVTVKDGDEEILAQVKASLRELTEEPRRLAPRRLAVRATPDRVREVLAALRPLGCRHLSAISAVDMGETFDVIYHVSAPRGVVVSVRASLPRKDPRIRSVTDMLPAATLYEREIRDLFGVEFVGHPDPRRLLLHEGWPEGEYPLRKDWKPATTGEETHA